MNAERQANFTCYPEVPSKYLFIYLFTFLFMSLMPNYKKSTRKMYKQQYEKYISQRKQISNII